MVDIIPHIKELLQPLNAQIEQAFPDTTVTVPLITLRVISDIATTNKCVEVFTRLVVQIDAYTHDKDETFALYQSINEIMTENGFTRNNAFPLPEGAFERYQMTYSCGIDISQNRIIV